MPKEQARAAGGSSGNGSKQQESEQAALMGQNVVQARQVRNGVEGDAPGSNSQNSKPTYSPHPCINCWVVGHSHRECRDPKRRSFQESDDLRAIVGFPLTDQWKRICDNRGIIPHELVGRPTTAIPATSSNRPIENVTTPVPAVCTLTTKATANLAPAMVAPARTQGASAPIARANANKFPTFGEITTRTVAEPKNSPCWNCWTHGHHRAHCLQPKKKSWERELLRQQLGIPKPQGYDAYLQGHECWNCWRSVMHHADTCPEPDRSMTDAENRRKLINATRTHEWSMILDRCKKQGTAVRLTVKEVTGDIEKRRAAPPASKVTANSGPKVITSSSTQEGTTKSIPVIKREPQDPPQKILSVDEIPARKSTPPHLRVLKQKVPTANSVLIDLTGPSDRSRSPSPSRTALHSAHMDSLIGLEFDAIAPTDASGPESEAGSSAGTYANSLEAHFGEDDYSPQRLRTLIEFETVAEQQRTPTRSSNNNFLGLSLDGGHVTPTDRSSAVSRDPVRHITSVDYQAMEPSSNIQHTSSAFDPLRPVRQNLGHRFDVPNDAILTARSSPVSSLHSVIDNNEAASIVSSPEGNFQDAKEYHEDGITQVAESVTAIPNLVSLVNPIRNEVLNVLQVPSQIQQESSERIETLISLLQSVDSSLSQLIKGNELENRINLLQLRLDNHSMQQERNSNNGLANRISQLESRLDNVVIHQEHHAEKGQKIEQAIAKLSKSNVALGKHISSFSSLGNLDRELSSLKDQFKGFMTEFHTLEANTMLAMKDLRHRITQVSNRAPPAVTSLPPAVTDAVLQKVDDTIAKKLDAELTTRLKIDRQRSNELSGQYRRLVDRNDHLARRLQVLDNFRADMLKLDEEEVAEMVKNRKK